LPLHLACQYNATDIALKLLEMYPKSAKVQLQGGVLPLHLACQYNATDIALKLLEMYPKGAQVQLQGGVLPLHLACHYNATDIALKLLEMYPKGAQVQLQGRVLPLHLACQYNATDIALKLLEVHPEGAKVRMKYGELAIHMACKANATDIALKLLEIYPKGAKVQTQDGELPVHLVCKTNATEIGYSKIKMNLLERLLRLYPERKQFMVEGSIHVLREAIIAGVSKNSFIRFLQAFDFWGGYRAGDKKDENGMTLLHLACASRTPNYHECISALLDFHPKYKEEQLSVQDNQGRTPFELLPANDSFLFHRLVANSLHLSERVVLYFVDIFPSSITTPNKYGMLPFHCACLNPNISIEILMLFISLSPEVIVPIQHS